MTDTMRMLLPIIFDGINPETNAQHAFVAGAIYDRAMANAVRDDGGEKDD